MLTLLIAHPVTMNTKESRPSRLLRISSIRRGMTMSTGDIKIPISTDAVFSLQRHRKVVLVVDLVESVSLMQADELGVIQRWQAFLAHVNQVVVPANKGRLVKSLGDGLILEFVDARQAAAAARSMHGWMETCAPVDGSNQLHLRAGIHSAEVYTDLTDIYGTGVNLAARIATLAGPGETVATQEIFSALADGIDGTLEDLGHCYLKNISVPVRAYRIGAQGPDPVMPMSKDLAGTSLKTVLAVIPFDSRSNDPQSMAIGDLIADGVIAHLVRSSTLLVISRLSTANFRGRVANAQQVGQTLGANYLLYGAYLRIDDRLLVTAELVDMRSGGVAWAERLTVPVADLLASQSELLLGIALGAHQAILDEEVRRVEVLPPPSLEGYALMLVGIQLMHRSTAVDMDRSEQLLTYLLERHPRSIETHAWLAKLLVLKSVCGLAEPTAGGAMRALEVSRKALSMAPAHALVLAAEGYVYTQLEIDIDKAQQRFDRALAINPNEPMAWLFKSVASAMWGSSASAVLEAEKAGELSPCDPLAYYVCMLRASALTIHGRFDDAIRWAQQSVRLNRIHAPTLRVLLTAQVGAGRIPEARATLAQLLLLMPQFTLSAYLNSGTSESKTRQQCARSLSELGLK